MTLTLEEKRKLYDKSKKLYEEIEKIKIRKEIKMPVFNKYYPSDTRYSNRGFVYATYSDGIYMYGDSVKKLLKELGNYIKYKDTGEDRINGELCSYVSDYTINALLDFIYHSDKILQTVKEQNEQERKELNDLLS